MAHSSIELRDFSLEVDLGTYGPEDVVPEQHLLDLSLTIDPSLVLVDDDSMEAIFDYDPLLAEIDRLARDRHYETQEYLMTRIVSACATHVPISAVDITLKKRPVHRGTGTLGVCLSVDSATLEQLRSSSHR